MKKEVSPATLAIVLGLALLLFGVFAYRTWTGPTATRLPNAPTKPVAPNAGGGPTAKDLEYMREYNRTHPGARTSNR